MSLGTWLGEALRILVLYALCCLVSPPSNFKNNAFLQIDSCIFAISKDIKDSAHWDRETHQKPRLEGLIFSTGKSLFKK